jgi:antirestriction protein ArdC
MAGTRPAMTGKGDRCVSTNLRFAVAHELIHWTKPQHPPGPRHGRIKWGDEGYAREELVAELGSAFLSADLGIASDMRPDHAAYIASWVKVLKDDKRFIFAAAAHAQRAADYLHGLQRAERGRPPHEFVQYVMCECVHTWDVAKYHG